MFWFDFNWQIQHLLNAAWWPINTALLIIAVLVGYYAFRKPIFALAGIIILLPTYLFRSQISFLPITYLEVLIWVAFAGWFFRTLKIGRASRAALHPYTWPILFILLASTISTIIAPDILAAAGLWKAYFIEALLFFTIFVNVVKTKSDREIIFWSLGIVALAISLLSIVQKFTAFGIAEAGWILPEQRRITALFTSPNAVGLFLAPIIAMYLGWLINDKKNPIHLLFKITVIILSLAAVVFTVSQGTWLGLLAAAIFLSFFGWSKKKTALIVVVGIILLMVIPITRDKIIPFATLQGPSGENRIELWQTSINYLTENPKQFLLGAGMFGFPQIHEQIRDPLKTEPLIYPHNIFLNFWLEIGLVGLIGFVWLIIKFFRHGFTHHEDKWIQLGIMAAMITVLVHGLIDVPYFKNDLAILFWIIVGLL